MGRGVVIELWGAFLVRVLVLEILRWFCLSRTLVSLPVSDISIITIPLDVLGRRCEVFNDVGTTTL